jgi:hypothetical protein
MRRGGFVWVFVLVPSLAFAADQPPGVERVVDSAAAW